MADIPSISTWYWICHKAGHDMEKIRTAADRQWRHRNGRLHAHDDPPGHDHGMAREARLRERFRGDPSDDLDR